MASLCVLEVEVFLKSNPGYTPLSEHGVPPSAPISPLVLFAKMLQVRPDAAVETPAVGPAHTQKTKDSA
jgi:hypothetical protein